MLAPFYYLRYFELVLSTMLARYADLLAPDELHFARAFPALPRSSRALLARMVMRRGVTFRATSLEYPEIGAAQAAAAPLIDAGWVDDEPMLHLDDLQRLLTKAELIRGLGLPRRYGNLRRTQLVAMLNAQYSLPRRFADWCPSGTGPVYALLAAPMCERFRLLYFGNDRQQWSEFVTADLGIFNFEKVERTLQSRPFQSRAQIGFYQRLVDCRDLFQAGMPLQDLLSLVPGTIEDGDWLEDRRRRAPINGKPPGRSASPHGRAPRARRSCNTCDEFCREFTAASELTAMRIADRRAYPNSTLCSTARPGPAQWNIMCGTIWPETSWIAAPCGTSRMGSSTRFSDFSAGPRSSRLSRARSSMTFTAHPRISRAADSIPAGGATSMRACRSSTLINIDRRSCERTARSGASKARSCIGTGWTGLCSGGRSTVSPRRISSFGSNGYCGMWWTIGLDFQISSSSGPRNAGTA